MNRNKSLFWLSFFIAAVAALFGWSAAENAGDLRTCELSMGAINNARGTINVQRVSANAFSRVIRIDYDITLPNRRQAINRYVICEFSSERLPPFRTGLTSLSTEFGPVSDSNLYMLKRFYLETNEAYSAKVPAIESGRGAGAGAIAAHMVEWLTSVMSKASLLTLMAFAFLAVMRLFKTMSSNMFYGISGTVCAAFGALMATGSLFPRALSLAVITGIVNGGCARVLYSESARKRSGSKIIAAMPWLLFSAFIGMALFSFNDRSLFVRHWLPEVFFRSFSFFTVAGYDISSTPTALALILLTLAVVLLPFTPRPLPDSERRSPSIWPELPIFLAIMTLTGVLSTIGILHFGQVANPVVIGTKALLIALVSVGGNGTAQRLQVFLTGLALISLEYALAPFLATTLINTISYALLVLLLIFSYGRQKE